jgi:hypothetical protein
MLKSLVLLAFPLLATCNVNRAVGGDDGDDTADAAVKPDLRRPPCLTLGCRVNSCKGVSPTALTGIVNIPAGNLPLPNAYVYVPNSPVEAIPDGVSCNRCDAPLSGSPIVKTRTDAMGRFRLENVPDGPNIPLVIQLGKWRRQITLSQVDPCVDNPVDPEHSRLPRSQDEGNIPKIALSTGGADALECLLRKMGIADREFTTEKGSGRVNLYTGQDGTPRFDPALNGGAAFTPGPAFWDSLDNLKKYDVILHSCEGSPTVGNKSVAARQALLDYLTLGGRAFGSHYHYVWVEQGPAPMPMVATWNHRGDLGSVTADIDTSFPSGAALADWLLFVGASTQRGKLDLTQAKGDVMAVNPALAQRWIHVPSQNNVQYLSFNAPLGAQETGQCGRMVYTDIHVANGDTSNGGLTFPSGGCRSGALSPQEKALVYLLFDLSNCLQPIPIPG